MTLTHSEILFAHNLDEKLHQIQGDLKKTMSNKYNQRPQFVTTVKKGVFLEPPPEVAALLGIIPSPQSGSSSSNSTTVVMYSYASKPKALHRNYHVDCSKLNNDRDGTYGNLMYDRRVVRGNTYATHPTSMPKWNPNFGYAKLLSENQEEQARQKEARRRAQARRRARVNSSRGRQGTPPPVPGRKHEPVQTERYLEELLDRPPETEVGCQTDLYLERPQTPMYIPSSGGEEKATQIFPGELFDFDLEVAPILENLVTRTIDLCLSEVIEEEELLDIQAQQRRLQEIQAFENHQKRKLSSSDISLLKDLNDEKSQKNLLPAITETLPIVLDKLQSEGYIKRSQDLDQEWLMDWITARISNPRIIEDFVKEALKFFGQDEQASSSPYLS